MSRHGIVVGWWIAVAAAVGTGGAVFGAGREAAGWWVVFARDIDEREWHATLRIASSDPLDDAAVEGEFTWDTPATSASTIFGTEQFTGRIDPASGTVALSGFALEDDRQIARADYAARLAPDGMTILEGRWSGETVRDSDFWHAVRASVVESTFEVATDGWEPVGTATFTWREEDGDHAGIGLLASDGPGEIRAPGAFLGDLSWRGRVPALVTFALRRVGPQWPGMQGPLVRLAGPAGEATFRIGNGVPGTWRTYVVPLWEGIWEVGEGTRLQEILADVESLVISPDGNRPADGGGTQWFHIDDIRLLRPVARPAPRLLEWRFTREGPQAAAGSEVLTLLGEDPEAPAVFTSTDGASIPHLGTMPSDVALFPAFDVPGSAQGIELALHTVPPNGGGQFVNRYTFVWDLLIPGSIGSGVPLLHTPPADPFARFDLGIQAFAPLDEGFFSLFGTPDLQAGLAANRWHRIVHTVDTIAGTARVYLDGAPVFTGGVEGFDRRTPLSNASLASMDTDGPAAILFKDIEGLVAHEIAVSRIAFVDAALSPAQVAALGGPRPDGVLVPWLVPLSIERSGPASVDLAFTAPAGLDQRLQGSDDLCRWTDLERVSGTGARERRTFAAPAASARFFRMIPGFD